MFDKIRLIFIFSVILCGAKTAALADIIHLTSGQTIEGTIVERTADEIKVDTGIGVLLTYYLDEIEEISSSPFGPSDISATDINNFEDIPPVKKEQGDAPTGPPHSVTMVPKSTATVDSAPPSSDLNTGTREEHFLMQQYKKTAQEMAQATDSSAPPPPPLDKEQYLRKQLIEKQALLKKEISEGVRLVDKKLSEGVKTFLKNKPHVEDVFRTESFPHHFPTVLIAVIVAFYAFVCWPWMMIARKLGLAGWMAWVPIIQIFLLFKMANRPLWWIFFLLIPVVNILIPIKLWMDIAKRFNKSILLGILMIVPVLNLLIPWYLAFSPAAEQ